MNARLVCELQQLDEQRARFQAQRDRSGMSGYLDRQARQQTELAQAETRLAELSDRLSRAEEELAEVKARRDALQAEVPGPLERGRVARDLEQVSARHDELETAILESMLEQEQLAPRLPGLRADLRETDSELEEAWAEERERLAALDSRLQETAQHREILCERLGSEWTAHYERARSQHPQPVAEGKGGRCGRCRMGLPDHEIRLLRNGEARVCSTCGSILVSSFQ